MLLLRVAPPGSCYLTCTGKRMSLVFANFRDLNSAAFLYWTSTPNFLASSAREEKALKMAIHSPFPVSPRVIFLTARGRKVDTESVNSSHVGHHTRFANFVGSQGWGQSCQRRMLERFCFLFFNAKTIEPRVFYKLFIFKFPPPHASLTELFPEHFWTHQPSVTHCLASWKGNRCACAVLGRACAVLGWLPAVQPGAHIWGCLTTDWKFSLWFPVKY